MLQLGSWVAIGDRTASIVAWGIETGVAPDGKHPIRKASRRKALASPMPMLLLWFKAGDEWWPLSACTPVPAPLYRIPKPPLATEPPFARYLRECGFVGDEGEA